MDSLSRVFFLLLSPEILGHAWLLRFLILPGQVKCCYTESCSETMTITLKKHYSLLIDSTLFINRENCAQGIGDITISFCGSRWMTLENSYILISADMKICRITNKKARKILTHFTNT